jgi:CBS domain-containing protein
LPINFLGTFVTTRSGPYKNQIDLKKAGTIHIVNGVRIFAIKNEISEPSTFGRLQALVEREAIPPRTPSSSRPASKP